MKTKKERQVRELIAVIKLHQLLLQLENQLEEYNNICYVANYDLTSELARFTWGMNELKSALNHEIVHNQAWEDIDGYT